MTLTALAPVVPETTDLPIAATPMSMLDRALASGASTEILSKLMDLQERHERNLARRAFDAAISAAKAEIPVIRKNRTVDFMGKTGIRTNYNHEDFAEVARTVDPILGKHGLSYRFRTSQDGTAVTVTCVLSHRDGFSEETSLSAGRDESGNKGPIQALGSTITFLQRYTLKAALGLAASDDDDGRAAAVPTEMITPDQVAIINDLAARAGDREALLKWLEVESVETIPAALFAKAEKALQTRIRKAAEAKAIPA